MSKEGALVHKENSPTAASATNRLFPPSGVMPYRVVMQTAMGGFMKTDVEAATGDEAAEKALAEYPGSKVANVTPAPQNNA
jgi:hypothetical protein